jgi:hypothetical protein
MILYEIALARTKKGELELVAVQYETIGRMAKPTKQAEKLLETYASWRNLSRALKYNLDLQEEFETVFGKYVE